MLALTDSSALSPPRAQTAPYNTRKPKPSNTIPIDIFTGMLGSFPLWPNHLHNIVKRGAKMTISNGFTDWNHSVGTTNEPISLSMYFSV